MPTIPTLYGLGDAAGIELTFTGTHLGVTDNADDIYVTHDDRLVTHYVDGRVEVAADPVAMTRVVRWLVEADEVALATTVSSYFNLHALVADTLARQVQLDMTFLEILDRLIGFGTAAQHSTPSS